MYSAKPRSNVRTFSPIVRLVLSSESTASYTSGAPNPGAISGMRDSPATNGSGCVCAK